MTDVIKTVVALQGNPVKREILGAGQDGYVLTWDNADNEWKAVQAAPSSTLQSQTFTSDGYWTCPTDVYFVIVNAFGGGGGAGNSNFYNVGFGGGGALLQTGIITVTPGDSYAITIGAGGLGATVSNTNGGDGYTTSFGTLFYAIGASGAITHYGGNIAPAPNFAFSTISGGSYYSSFLSIGAGYGGGYTSGNGYDGLPNFFGLGSFAGGTGGGSSGGSGGGAGPNGNGGNGGTSGNAGSNASANSGAGGGGAGNSSFACGNGGSGMLTVAWIA
jgi:hypothetical protein